MIISYQFPSRFHYQNCYIMNISHTKFVEVFSKVENAGRSISDEDDGDGDEDDGDGDHGTEEGKLP